MCTEFAFKNIDDTCASCTRGGQPLQSTMSAVILLWKPGGANLLTKNWYLLQKLLF